MTKIHSYDVFDTVLTRKVGTPKSSFFILGRKLKRLNLIQCSAEAFSSIREDSERRAFKKAGGLDSNVSLSTIYQEVGYALCLLDEEIQEIRAMEEQLEIDLLSPVPKILRSITDARKQGLKIFFISDMYIGSKFIEERLKSFEILAKKDRIYVSCDYNKSKKSEKLFNEVLVQERINKSDIIHIGNHSHSDVNVPRKLGFQVIPFLEGNLNRYEKIMENFVEHSEGLSSAMAGASRLARLSSKQLSVREDSLREVAAGVASPIVVGFTLWVLRRAESLGLNRLYFLSRDGQILVRIANCLAQKLNINIKVIYLYGSRQAWLLPSLTSIQIEKLNAIFNLENEVDYLSPRIIFSRFSISPSEIKSSLKKIKLLPKDYDENLDYQERKRLL